jgi:hypothetical protein
MYILFYRRSHQSTRYPPDTVPDHVCIWHHLHLWDRNRHRECKSTNTWPLRKIWSTDACWAKWQNIQDGSNPIPEGSTWDTNPTGYQSDNARWSIHPLHRSNQLTEIVDKAKSERWFRHNKENCTRIQRNGKTQTIVHKPRRTSGHNTPRVPHHYRECRPFGDAKHGHFATPTPTDWMYSTIAQSAWSWASPCKR